MIRKLALLLLVSVPLSAQVTVQIGKQLHIPEPGASAAVSLDTRIATASIMNNTLNILGVGTGEVRIVALYPANIAEVRVHVVLPPPVFPPGFIPPANRGNGSGSYEVRFSTDRMQFENVVDLSTQSLLGSSQLHIVSATFPEQSTSSTFLPSAFYRISTPHLDLTLLDQNVEDSPLTLENVVLRGFHLRYRRWHFHGGYTTSADFADVFIPVQKELAAGISYNQPLGRFLHIVPHAYFLRSIDLQSGEQRSAIIGSVLFKADLPQQWKLESEVAAGRGMGYYAGLEHLGTSSTLRATLASKSIDFPELRSSGLPGLTGDASWSQRFTPRFGLIVGATVDHIQLRNVKQDSENASASVHYKLFRSFSAGTGASYQSFVDPGSYSSRTLTLPQQIDFDRRWFGVGYQYEFATTSHNFSNGSGQRQTLRLDVKRFQIGEYIDLETDAVGIHAFSSDIPQVERNLQRQAISAAGPDAMSTMLRSAAFMQSLGVASQAELLTVPRRLQEGGSLTWSSRGARPHQINISAFTSHNRYATSQTTDYSASASYMKQVGNSNQLEMSASVVQSSLGQSGGTQSVAATQPQMTPVFSFSFRHLLSRSPEVLSADKSFSINGTVFMDSKGSGRLQDGMDTLPHVTIVLDGKKIVVTDSQGNFYFGGVSSGTHRVQMVFASNREHYFTTPQDVTVEAGSIVNFGIHFPAIELWGYVQDDAGEGLENIMLRITGPDGLVVTATAKSGKFLLPDIKPGNYTIETDLESVPVGHSTEDLAPVQVLITSSSSAHPVIQIPAIRVLSGTVTKYDAAAGQYLPLEGAIIRVVPLGKSVMTTSMGKFTIGGLPPGDVEVKVSAAGSSLTHTIRMPVQPSTVKEDYKVSALSGQIIPALKGVSLDTVR